MTLAADTPNAHVSPRAHGLLMACLGPAVVVPVLLAYNIPPSATFLNQAAALIGWSAALLTLVPVLTARSHALSSGSRALLAALGLCGLSCLGAMAWNGLPAPLGWSTLGTIAAAALVFLCGAMLAPDDAETAFGRLCWGLLIAGGLSAAIALVQVHAPELTEGNLLASASGDGRAAGNLRQPNHLASLLLWSLIALAWLHERGRIGRTTAFACGLVFVYAVVLTASRTGVAGAVLIGLWGVLDRRLSRDTRVLLLGVPLAYAALWGGMAAWSQLTHQALGAESRITDTAESANSRVRIWSNTLTLIAEHPWLGVGFGEFNFAWSLHPFPGRPTAFFDHTHNLPLQLLVEMGVPLALLVLGLLVYAWWRGFVAGHEATGERAGMLRAAFMLVLMIGVHSMFEYPLWYAYFLLPAAFAWGLCLGGGGAGAAARPARRSRVLAAGALVMLPLSVVSVLDYLRVAAVFSADEAVPLAERIADGEHSWFFAHHAYYAAATTADHPGHELPAFRVATHYLLDTRLMMAWAQALHEAGDEQRARHVAARLREFRNDDSKVFFEACDAPAARAALPFQCQPPTQPLDYRDFR